MAARSPSHPFARRNHHGSSPRVRRAPTPKPVPVELAIREAYEHGLAKRGGCGFLWLFDCPKTSTTAPAATQAPSSPPSSPPPAPRPAPAPAPESSPRTTARDRTTDRDDPPTVATVTNRRTVTASVSTRISTSVDASGHTRVITAVLTAPVASNNTAAITLAVGNQTSSGVDLNALPSSPLPTQTADNAAASPSARSNSEPNTGAIVGSVIGALTFVTVVALVLTWLWHKKTQRREAEKHSQVSQYMSETRPPSEFVQFNNNSANNSRDNLPREEDRVEDEDRRYGHESQYLAYNSSSRPRSFLGFGGKAPQIPPVPPVPRMHSSGASTGYGTPGAGTSRGNFSQRPAFAERDDASHYGSDAHSTRAPTWNVRLSQMSAYSDEPLPASGNQFARRA